MPNNENENTLTTKELCSLLKKSLADHDPDIPATLYLDIFKAIDAYAKKEAKSEARAQSQQVVDDAAPRVLSALTTMVTALNTPVRLADVGQRIKLSNRIPAERQVLSKAFNKLQKQGKVMQVGFKEGKILPTSEVNNFQRRWIPVGWEPVADVDESDAE